MSGRVLPELPPGVVKATPGTSSGEFILSVGRGRRTRHLILTEGEAQQVIDELTAIVPHRPVTIRRQAPKK